MNALLDRLEKVRQTGPGRWIASCPGPNHEHGDRHPSLHLCLKPDGVKLIICRSGGCDASDIMAALGLSLSDLFPDKLDHHIKPTRSRVPLRDLVPLLDHESLIVYITACDLLKKKTMDDESLARLRISVQRIGEVRDELT